MSGHSTFEPQNGFLEMDGKSPFRLPVWCILPSLHTLFPKNLNYFLDVSAAILAVCLVAQIVTGIVLVMHYAPNTALAFAVRLSISCEM